MRRVVREIFGSKTGGVTGGRKELHNENLHHFTKYEYYSSDQTKDDEMEETAARVEEMRNAKNVNRKT
jgi:hypothetical protein